MSTSQPEGLHEARPNGVAVIGVGVMGGALVRRFLDVGVPVTIYDADDRALGRFAGEATIAASPADAAVREPFVVLSLNTAAIVESVAFGGAERTADSSLSAGATSDTVVIDMSSIDPDATRRFSRRLRDQTGAAWVDAPLSGGAPAAATGGLSVMVGGDDADVERALPVLATLASTIVHVGPSGAGQAVKLVNQVLVGGAFATLAEAAELTRRYSLPAEEVLSVLSAGRADSAVLREFYLKFVERDLRPTGRIDNMYKDLATALDAAAAVGLRPPMLTANVELHRQLVDAGHGAQDSAAMMFAFDESAERHSNSPAPDSPATNSPTN